MTADDSDEVELVRVSGKFAAEPVMAALRANGIPARARGEAAGELYGITVDGMGEVTILVRKAQVEAARELLKAADRGELRLGDTPGGDNSR
jgi:hypothetical protein